jgi:hypothetical protein
MKSNNFSMFSARHCVERNMMYNNFTITIFDLRDLEKIATMTQCPTLLSYKAYNNDP